MESTIRLFKALPIETKRKKRDIDLEKETIKRGFIFAPEVVYNYSRNDLIGFTQKIGLTSEQFNASFHKSWVKIRDAELEQLVVEQIAHYLTTYGKEEPELYLVEKEVQWGVEDLSNKVSELKDIELGRIQDRDYVYIPKEVLNLPELDIDNLKLVIIKGYTKEELKSKLLNLLNLGIALAEDTMKDVLDIATFVEINEEDIGRVKNKEVKAALYDYLNLFPKNPVEFLRFVVYKSTNKTLLIKNIQLISEIKTKDNLEVIKLFANYEKKYGLKKLAEIFYRYKPIFLAFRVNKKLKVIVNKIRRLARKYHKPLPEDYLNTVTSKLKRGEGVDVNDLTKRLEEVNTFRKIRLAYALKFRTKDVDSILYRIRNGKSYATDFSFEKKDEVKEVLGIVFDSIVKDVRKNVKGKKIYIPDYINYSLPATEKQFTGYFPSGTCVSVPKDIVFGIHWKNVKQNRIDLDLSLISAEVGKIGWDGFYGTEGRDILFSGDMTDASGIGATELFYVQRQSKKALILFVNYYNFGWNGNVEVPFKIIVAKEKATNFRENYMVNPNNILSTAESKVNQKQKMIGLLVSTTKENRFYFAESYLGRSITSSGSKFVEDTRKYLFSFYENMIGLRDILEKSEVMFVDKDKAEIDLSPENLEKDSILKLLTG